MRGVRRRFNLLPLTQSQTRPQQCSLSQTAAAAIARHSLRSWSSGRGSRPMTGGAKTVGGQEPLPILSRVFQDYPSIASHEKPPVVPSWSLPYAKVGSCS
ncbi:hypothetical protein CPAR01_06168 [Colletotrichum paranaense]|uniref:Uncharacterized protein n=1 Tax=Colletotrichum paranaense TaxID=1914294 RepID=A0ABQ9SUU4_9PEZI|nr:uncharacterized protein CPAR01_06168 [Colletotrichum paranaense]KAK1542781.1 hypothetical protein CPAR01_06168 [Colletotrichum paranaense]